MSQGRIPSPGAPACWLARRPLPKGEALRRHTRDRIAPVARAGGTDGLYAEHVSCSGNQVADGDRARIGEQPGILPIARSVVRTHWRQLHFKYPRIADGVQLQDQLGAPAVPLVLLV